MSFFAYLGKHQGLTLSVRSGTLGLGTHENPERESDMRTSGKLGVLAASVVLAGLAACAPAASAATTSGQHSRTVPVVAYGFGARGLGAGWHDPQVRPDRLYLGNGGAPIILRIRWGTWTRSAATATDGFWTESCRPTCAASPYYRHPGTLRLFGVRIHNGVRYFSGMIAGWTTDHGKVRHREALVFSDHGGDWPFWLPA